MNEKAITATDLPYGSIIGLTGKYDEKVMLLNVSKITLPSLPPQKPFSPQAKAYARKSLFLSSPKLEFLLHFMNEIVLDFYSEYQCLVIMGLGEKFDAAAYRELDSLFAKTKSKIDIFLMPDEKNGSSYPQRRLHNILFKESYSDINLVNNPQLFYPNPQTSEQKDLDVQFLSGSILACCGENIKDFLKNSSLCSKSTEVMKSLLEFSHLSPSSPFSLKCQMMEEDYLVINELPQVFLASNCDQN